MRYIWIIMLVIADCCWIGFVIRDIYECMHIMKEDFEIWDLNEASITCIGLHIFVLFLISLVSWFKYKLVGG